MTEPLIKQLLLKHSIERALDSFKKIGRKDLTPAKIRARIATLTETWLRFEDGHAALVIATPETSRANIDYFRGEFFDAVEDVFQTAQDFMSDCLEELESVSHLNASNAPTKSAFSLARLPTSRLLSLKSVDQTSDELSPSRDSGNLHEVIDRSNVAISSLKSVDQTSDELSQSRDSGNLHGKIDRTNVAISSLKSVDQTSDDLSQSRDSGNLHDVIDRIHVAMSSLKSVDRTSDEFSQTRDSGTLPEMIDRTIVAINSLKSADRTADELSQMTCFSQRLAQLRRATKRSRPTSGSVVGGVPAGTARFPALVSFSPRDSQSPSYSAEAAILKDSTKYEPKSKPELAALPHLSAPPWADPNPTTSDPAQLIVADLYHEVIFDGRRKRRRGEPTAPISTCRWVISGPLGSISESMLEASRDQSDDLRARSISVHLYLTLPFLEGVIQIMWKWRSFLKALRHQRKPTSAKRTFSPHSFDGRTDDPSFAHRSNPASRTTRLTSARSMRDCSSR